MSFSSLHLYFVIQSNLVYSKSKGLESLFRSIESSNYREVDISIILNNP